MIKASINVSVKKLMPPEWIWPYAAVLNQQIGKKSDRAAEWPNPKCGPPDETFLQSQAWPNPATGPTSIEAFRENTDKRQGGWRAKQQLNDNKLLRGPSRYKLGRA